MFGNIVVRGEIVAQIDCHLEQHQGGIA